MRFFLACIRSCRTALVYFLLCAGIFLSSFALYRLPLEAVLYPCTLCALLGLLLGSVRLLQRRKRHQYLSELKSAAVLPSELLPVPKAPEEEDLSELLRVQLDRLTQLEETDRRRFSDITDYYTVWAHQIKTPIASMKLALQSEDTPLSHRLKAELFRVEQYVEMVLAYLRLDSSESDYVFAAHALDGLLRTSIRKFAPLFIDKKLRLDFTPTDLTLITDEKWFCFVLEQLLSNAVKYTRTGGVTIELREKNVLAITDTGIGIAPEDLPRIFEKGFTGLNGRMDKSASGLGLYLSRRVCENLGIRIRAESILNQGTTLLLDLNQYKTKYE